MRSPFELNGMVKERLLKEWDWLAPEGAELLAVSNFGDLFLKSMDGSVRMIDVQQGTLETIAASQGEFYEDAHSVHKQNAWFHQGEFESLVSKGLRLDSGQCVGFKTPLILREGDHSVYAADIDDYVSYLGDFHRQLSKISDGDQVRIVIKQDSKAGDL